MQSQPESDSCLYEYAIVQFCPRVERGECLNVGLVMMCKRSRWLRARIKVDPELAGMFAPGWDTDLLASQLASFEQVAAGCPGPIGSLDPHERFRWLTAVRSACITTTRPHPGHTGDLDATFDRLFAELVDRK